MTASWSGDATVEGAISAIRTFNVTAAPPGIPLELITFGALVVIVVVLVLLARRRIM